MKYWWISFAVVFLLAACEVEELPERLKETEEYFDVKAFLALQEEKLIALNPSLEKVAAFGGKEEKVLIELDSAAIERELDVFRQMDITKPVLEGLYQVKEEEQKGMQVITYQTAVEEGVQIYFLKVYKAKGEDGKVKQLEALFSDKNILFNSTRLLNVKFEELSGILLPTSYTIDGKQKMIFKDPVEYKIKGTFLY